MLKFYDESICKPLEKGQCGSCLKKTKQNKQQTSKELSPHFFTTCFKQNIWKIIIWQYV